MNQFKLSGVIPALITPFDSTGKVNFEQLKNVVRHLLNKGVNGLYLTGSSGEMLLLSETERNRIVETVIEEVNGKVPIIVQVGAIATELSIRHAQAAKKAGADAISAIPPIYWRFQDQEIFNYYEDICSAVDLPMIIYNISLAGLMNLDLINRIAKIDTVIGIKYTATDLYRIGQMKSAIDDRFLVYSGCDELALSGLINGADGMIGSFYNLIPELFLKIYAYFRSNQIDAAIKYQDAANKIILKALAYNYFSVIKMGLRWQGIDAGYCRKPFSNYSLSEEKEIRSDFALLRDLIQIHDVDFLNAL